MFDNSDDHDFKPSGSSKLDTLFNESMISEDLNTSLTYTAPKQPKAEKELEACEPVKNKVRTTLLLAKVVSLWKLDNKVYNAMGTHGLAVIGSIDLNLFEIILYREKNNVLVRRKITNGCSFYNQKECFSSFYDNENQNWLVKFENLHDQTNFCKEIQNYGVYIKVTEGPSQTKETVPSISNNNNNDSLPSKSDEFPKSTVNMEPVVEVHSDSSDSQKKASILTRMAKMGQQMIPSQMINKSANLSDSELEEFNNDPKIPPRKYKRMIHIEKTFVPKEEAVERQICSENQVVQRNNYSTQFPSVPYNLGPYDGFNHYIMTQNAELKMSLAQISAKLDRTLSGNNVSDKYDEQALKSKIKALELKCENLQAEVQRSEDKYHDLQKKYDDLQKRSNLKEKEEQKIIIQNLTEEMDKVKLDLKTVREKVINYETLEKEVDIYANDIKEQNETIEMQRAKLKQLEEFYEENKGNRDELQTTVENLNETVATLKLKLKEYENLKTEEEKQKLAEDDTKVVNSFSNKIKDAMDSMYRSILHILDQDHSYSALELKAVVAENLKGTTFQIIDDFSNLYKNGGENVLSDSQTE